MQQTCKTVNYVLSDGQVRPMVIAKVHGGKLNHIDGLVFLRERNDAGAPVDEPYMLLRAVPEDANKAPGTWHFPEEAN